MELLVNNKKLSMLRSKFTPRHLIIALVVFIQSDRYSPASLFLYNRPFALAGRGHVGTEYRKPFIPWPYDPSGL